MTECVAAKVRLFFQYISPEIDNPHTAYCSFIHFFSQLNDFCWPLKLIEFSQLGWGIRLAKHANVEKNEISREMVTSHGL